MTAAALAGCGAPGIPEPPSLELARPVRDLKAVRKGNEVRLTWSVPTQTTDHQTFRHVGQTQICRGSGSSLPGCGTPIAELKTENPPSSATKSRFHRSSPGQAVPQASYIDQLPVSLELQSPTSDLVYAVSVLNSYGKNAGLSNQVQVPSAPVLPPPADLSANLSAKGVRLTWASVAPVQQIPSLKYEYRIYRRDIQTQRDSTAGEIPVVQDANPEWLDTSFEWEKSYDYRLTIVTLVETGTGIEQVEGEDTPSLRVVAHDVFPPAIPTGVQAVFSGPGQKLFIDVVWASSPDSDLAGYNVYRHQEGTEPVRVNTAALKSPAFRDFDVVSGHKYFYSVSAVDIRGNESSRSEEASETVP